MKTFRDLRFRKTRGDSRIRQARISFDNGYGVSVVRGHEKVVGSHLEIYEVAVMKNGIVSFDTPITDDVFRKCTKEEVTKIMRNVQELPTTHIVIDVSLKATIRGE